MKRQKGRQKDRKINGKFTNARTVGVVFGLYILFTIRPKELRNAVVRFRQSLSKVEFLSKATHA